MISGTDSDGIAGITGHSRVQTSPGIRTWSPPCMARPPGCRRRGWTAIRSRAVFRDVGRPRDASRQHERCAGLFAQRADRQCEQALLESASGFVTGGLPAGKGLLLDRSSL